jgi:[ribosomal protein S5]-alanine N-acetyltransferase
MTMPSYNTYLPIGDFAVRSFALDDAPAVARHANNRNVWLNLRDLFPFPYNTAHAQAWIREVMLDRPETAFAIASATEAIGGIGLHRQGDFMRRSAELGYWLGEEYWGRGIVTGAVRATTAWGFAQLDIDRIFAQVFAWNPASARVLEKAGFTFEGRLRGAVYKDGMTTDLLSYGLLRTDLPQK